MLIVLYLSYLKKVFNLFRLFQFHRAIINNKEIIKFELFSQVFSCLLNIINKKKTIEQTLIELS